MLNPTFLLASTINADGCIELPIVEEALPFPVATALFWPGEDGAFVQRIASVFSPAIASPSEATPLDMVFLGRCLSSTLGGLTPELFRVEEGGPGCVRLVRTNAAAEQVRVRMLRDAFTLYLAAYEERLV